MSVLKIQRLKAAAGLWSVRVFTYRLGSFVACTEMSRKGLALDVTQELLRVRLQTPLIAHGAPL